MSGGDQQLPAESHVDPDLVVAKRDGDVLLKATLLKSDHFPGTGLKVQEKWKMS
jgi:hypothetical protein